ncbi:hypothetical protein LPB142_17800 (plasmid) [Rhodobacter xanthinilyticus]|uniref:Uncharacterized protein n=1 Tax=Rhodobacter xanthinilyticus TaxID=1850250 RepID=A0A1D9MHH3_9RHOB|nr:hypothetical protein LPB142_17800 [Rhodobacter xanthinilyticus]
MWHPSLPRWRRARAIFLHTPEIISLLCESFQIALALCLFEFFDALKTRPASLGGWLALQGSGACAFDRLRSLSGLAPRLQFRVTLHVLRSCSNRKRRRVHGSNSGVFRQRLVLRGLQEFPHAPPFAAPSFLHRYQKHWASEGQSHLRADGPVLQRQHDHEHANHKIQCEKEDDPKDSDKGGEHCGSQMSAVDITSV